MLNIEIQDSWRPEAVSVEHQPTSEENAMWLIAGEIAHFHLNMTYMSKFSHNYCAKTMRTQSIERSTRPFT